MSSESQDLRHLPSVTNLLKHPIAAKLRNYYGHTQTVNAIRQVLEQARQQIVNGYVVDLAAEDLFTEVQVVLNNSFTPTLRPVINATGVILHTNLGRSPLSIAAQQAMIDIASQYNTLEFDLDSGKRGSRLRHAEELLIELTGAEAGIVVNNAAAGLVLILSALAKNREVILSRSQLVEIGGGFRIPDIMQQGGARMVEVGTTNRTRLSDYESAITEETALLMRVHASNFKQIGFVESVSLKALARLAHDNRLILVDDLGSGALLDTAQFGFVHEPTVQESIAAGADLVVFSGDKLLGGPQAGIIVGKQELIQELKKHPLARVMRADKLCYAALTATLNHYRKDDAQEHIPIWWMISQSIEQIKKRAIRWAEEIGGELVDGYSTVGGGSLPGETLPTVLVALRPSSPQQLTGQLRQAQHPIIARIENDQVLFDPRTVLPGQERDLLDTIKHFIDK